MADSGPRVLHVSMRLPVTARVEGDVARVVPSAGGVATGLARLRRDDTLWFGWPGITVERLGAAREALDDQLTDDGLRAIHLSNAEQAGFYDGIANGVLWPIFHSQTERLPMRLTGWDAYETVNARFADAVAAAYQPGDMIWVHDYQLLRLPALLRARLPDARVGFFLHIPFPAADVFGALPHRTTVLHGMLGADLIGVHTNGYVRNLADALQRFLGLRPGVERVEYEGRLVTLGVFPMGVDAARFDRLAARPGVRQRVQELREPPGAQMMLGIDRLDYTKGIPRRLLAFEQLLQRYPELREHVRLVQVTVPSRTRVKAYDEFRRHIDRLVGRINGAMGTPTWTPVHYMYRSVGEEELVALYRATDVMLVTPLRDGMNLVAKEFVASRGDEDGVLVLSEFTGAADELGGALRVNPFDVDDIAGTYHRALVMADAARRRRMRLMRARVLTYTIDDWARRFLDALASVSRAPLVPPSPYVTVDEIAARVTSARHLRLLLDYDGTLVPVAESPELARPDAELLALLERLAGRPRTEVHLVSGRTRESIDAWFADVPITLHAEHGLWSRRAPDGEWRRSLMPAGHWRDPVRTILQRFVERTPGSHIEEKSLGFAWHYRMADPEFGAWQANELRLHLVALLATEPVEVIEGRAVLEVRAHGAHKGIVTTAVAAAAPPGTLLVGVGDDLTDDDLFASLPENALAIGVGGRPREARMRLRDPEEVRALLERVAVSGVRLPMHSMDT